MSKCQLTVDIPDASPGRRSPSRGLLRDHKGPPVRGYEATYKGFGPRVTCCVQKLQGLGDGSVDGADVAKLWFRCVGRGGVAVLDCWMTLMCPHMVRIWTGDSLKGLMQRVCATPITLTIMAFQSSLPNLQRTSELCRKRPTHDIHECLQASGRCW